MITYSSAVLVSGHFDLMRRFYENVLGQAVRFDFGSCVQFECGLSIWQPAEGHPAKNALNKMHCEGNGALELCFEAEDFDAQAARVSEMGVMLAHGVIEESWGQRTLRFYDPDGNLVELGESMPAFCRRLYASGLDLAEVAKKTGIEQKTVKHYLDSLR
jgi:catechol 2,3-dioxygenase-like lactoylglutathione lyase family enzyme